MMWVLKQFVNSITLIKQVTGKHNDGWHSGWSENMAFRSHVLFPVVFADVWPQRHPVLNLLVAEGTVEGEAVNVVALNVLPVVRVVKRFPSLYNLNSHLTWCFILPCLPHLVQDHRTPPSVSTFCKYWSVSLLTSAMIHIISINSDWSPTNYLTTFLNLPT